MHRPHISGTAGVIRPLGRIVVTRGGDRTEHRAYQFGRLTLPMTPAWTARLVLTDEGEGRCRVRLGETQFVGIYRRWDDRLWICWRAADRGYPPRFGDDGRQDVLMLRWVRPGEMNHGQTLSENYTRLHPRPRVRRGAECSGKYKTPGKSGVFRVFLF